MAVSPTPTGQASAFVITIYSGFTLYTLDTDTIALFSGALKIVESEQSLSTWRTHSNRQNRHGKGAFSWWKPYTSVVAVLTGPTAKWIEEKKSSKWISLKGKFNLCLNFFSESLSLEITKYIMKVLIDVTSRMSKKRAFHVALSSSAKIKRAGFNSGLIGSSPATCTLCRHLLTEVTLTVFENYNVK